MESVIDFIKNKLNIKYSDSIVVGVSGGPDSMALLNILIDIRKNLDIQIICAHVNHNIRKESEDEKKFVEKYCHSNNIVFEYHKIDEYGDDNFHNEARSIRYKYFGQIVKKHQAAYLLTAHHGDDLIETILMRIVRGSTLRGYSGFSKVIKKDDYLIVRPLINVSKDEIIEYNKQNNVSYINDISNEKDIYTRNRFRKYIVSDLKKEDKKVHEKFYKFSRVLLEYNDYIDHQVEKVLQTVYPQNVLNIEKFLQEEQIIQKKIIYYILEKLYQDDLMLITDQHVKLTNNLIKSQKPNILLYLPNNIKVIKAYNNVIFIEEELKGNDYEIEISQYVNLPNGKNIEVVEKSNLTTNDVCRLSNNDVKFPLHVRNRQKGDKINIKGMLGKKKISDIFIDEKIPVEDRKLWPIVIDSNNVIVWIPGLKKSKFDKQKNENYDIILKYY